MEKQEKALNMQGNTVAGPKEKAGNDSVKAELSYFTLGVQRATEVSKTDERLFVGKNTVRQDLIAIIKSPQEAWKSYTDGFKAVLDARKKEDKPTMSLSVLRSNISRVLNAAKGQPVTVAEKLADTTIRWEKLLKSLPKAQPTMGRPAEIATETVAPGAVNPETETNVGTLLQVINTAAKRLVTIGKEKHAPFAEYIGSNVLETVTMAQADYQKAFAKHQEQGHLTDTGKTAIRVELGLAETVAQPVAVAA